MAKTGVHYFISGEVDLPSDKGVRIAFKDFLRRKPRSMRCFEFPDSQFKLWVKFEDKRRTDNILREARNIQYAHNAVERFYMKSATEQQQLLGAIYKEPHLPPRVRVPKVFRVTLTEDFVALLMEFIPGDTLDWKMRVKLGKTDEPFGWTPKLCCDDLSYFERELSSYVDAIGLLFAVPAPPDARIGLIGGGFPKHRLFHDESTQESTLPYEFTSRAYFAKELNKVPTQRREHISVPS